MKNIPLSRQFVIASFALAFGASLADAATSARNLPRAQSRFGPPVVVGPLACVPQPPLPKRTQTGGSPAAITSKC